MGSLIHAAFMALLALSAGYAQAQVSVPTNFAASTMALSPSNSGQKLSDGSVLIWSNGGISRTVSFPASGNYKFTIQASGTSASGVWPNLELRIDGVAKYNLFVVSNQVWTYPFTIAAPGGNHSVTVAFTNDLMTSSEDRNLKVYKVDIAAASGTSTGGTPSSGGTSPSTGASLLFKSGFENGISLGTPYACGSPQCLQDIQGQDAGFAWPPKFWGGTGALQLLADQSVTPTSISQYMINQIQTVTGHNGTPTRALYQELRGTYNGIRAQQDPYVINAASTLAQQGDMYTRMWIKLQPDLATAQLIPGQTPDGGWGNWRVLWEWKTGGQGSNWQGDYRYVIGVNMNSSRQLFWSAQADNVANSGAPKKVYYSKADSGVRVPVGEWFKFETYTHRSGGSDGRLWAAVNGQVIADFRGPNLGVNSLPINRIMLFQNYTGGYFPSYQWIDDVEIYNGFPSDAAAH